jgi:hypothetical protein
MATTVKQNNPFAHAWYVEINDETYEVINKWWKTQTSSSMYKNGFCGFCLNENLKLFLGHIKKEDLIKKEHYDFGIELSFNDFVKYVLNEEPYLPKPLNIDKLLIILNYINNYEK